MEKIKVILNSKASGGENPRLIQILQKKLFRSILDIQEPASLEELKIQLKHAVNASYNAVIAVGGDGTANLMLQTLVDSSVALLLVPAGTANDLAAEMGLSQNLEESLISLRNNKVKKIDVININGHFMATNGGIGIGADVAMLVNSLRSRFSQYKTLMRFMGSEIYSATLAAKLLSPQLKRINLRVNCLGRTLELQTPLVLVSNQPKLGGDFVSAPDTKNDDGLFNIGIFAHKSRTQFIKALLALKQGHDISGDPEFFSFECPEAHLQLLDDSEIAFFGDGEALTQANSFHLKIHSKSFCLFEGIKKGKSK